MADNDQLVIAGRVWGSPEQAAGRLAGYPPLTLSVYDFGDPTPPDRVTPADLGRMLTIEPLYQSAAILLLEQGAGAPWDLVPVGTRLEDADPEKDLYWDAARLFAYFDDLPGIGFAIASKLLHLKRPEFFPILDSVVQRTYGLAAKTAFAASERAPGELPPGASKLYWAAIRADIIDTRNRTALPTLRQHLDQADDALVRRIASLPDVRLLDMLAWLGPPANGSS